MTKGKLGAIILGALLVIGAICLFICIERVPVGYEAIVYSMDGGVQDETLTQGWHFVSPMKKVKLFTVSNEQLLLTKDSRENSEEDESFKVATSDNASIAISFQMSYRFIPEKLTNTYKAFKGMDGESIVNNRVRTVLKSRVSEITTTYSMMDLYSGNRNEINNKITKYLAEKFGQQFGLDVIDASIVDVHPDEKLQAAIDNRVEAQQRADQAKAEQETAKVEAETKMIKAKNDADIKILEAKAEADANKAIAESITKELVDLKLAEARLEHGWITVSGSDATAVVKE